MESKSRTKSLYTNRIPPRDEFHKYYAGEIYPGDFDTDGPCIQTINRIVSASIFDDQCRQRYEERKRRENCHR